MAVIQFTSRDDCDVIEIELIGPQSESLSARLFVDSGFTGDSCLIVSEDANRLALAKVSAVQTAGALEGTQPRVLLNCRVPALAFQRNLVAIVTDISVLSLPADVTGMVGLSFLRQFSRWASDQSQAGSWQFFLRNGKD